MDSASEHADGGEIPAAEQGDAAVADAAGGVRSPGPPSDEQALWWDRGVCDGVEAVMACAGVALSIVRETFESGDAERAHLLSDVYAGFFDPRRIGRREDGRIDATSLFIAQERINEIFGRSRRPRTSTRKGRSANG